MNHLNLIMPVMIVFCLLYGIYLVMHTLKSISDQMKEEPRNGIENALAACVIITCCAMLWALGWGAGAFMRFIVNELWR